MEFSEGSELRWAPIDLRRPEFQLLNPIAGVSPTPFLIFFESSTGVLFAIPAKSKIIDDRCIMRTRPVLNEK